MVISCQLAPTRVSSWLYNALIFPASGFPSYSVVVYISNQVAANIAVLCATYFITNGNEKFEICLL